jgi:hypothetical protein
VWSQPWGRAIAGPLKGAELELLPSQLLPWKTWKELHPTTRALDLSGSGRLAREGFTQSYIIGVTLGEAATAFPYLSAAEAEIINDSVGPYPVVVIVDPEARSVQVFLRQVEDRVLEFASTDGMLQDTETGTTWDLKRGVAVDGLLQGKSLRPVPYIPAFSAAWRDFYPHSRWYEE